jgi:hypothetical protein
VTKISRSQCTKADKANKIRYAIALLEAIDGVYKVAKSGKVTSVEVQNKPRKMTEFRFFRFGRQGFGQKDFPRGHQDVDKPSAELFHRFFLKPAQETDDEFFSHIAETVIAGIKKTDPLNRFIKRR